MDTAIRSPNGIRPYPRKTDRILDRPVADDGGNFGRLARTGLMDAYVEKLEGETLCGIKISYWRDFLRTFQEGTDEDQARKALARLTRRIEGEGGMAASPVAEATLAIVEQLERLLRIS